MLMDRGRLAFNQPTSSKSKISELAELSEIPVLLSTSVFESKLRLAKPFVRGYIRERVNTEGEEVRAVQVKEVKVTLINMTLGH